MKELSIIKQMIADGQISQEVAKKYFPKLKVSDDESWFKEIELMCLNFSNDTNYREKFFTWLKFLKERVQPQPQQEWSEEDEEIYNNCICAMRASVCGFPKEEKFVEQVDNWFKSLKERVQPQPQQEWSEEDKQHIRELERLVKQVWAIAEHENDKDTIHKMSDLSFFLKTIKPQLKQGGQNNWKPSKDEMDALYGLAYITNKIDDKKDEGITKLYQDLKREFFNGASYENMFPLSPIDSNTNIEK